MVSSPSGKELIKKNFSKSARSYDKYAQIQKVLAKKLQRYLPEGAVSNVLDIGCGTGNLTKILKEKYRNSHITAIDISPQMVEIAKKKINDNVEFIVGDAEEYEDKKEYDVIASNATMQWFYNLEKTLSKYKKMLSKDGAVIFSIFGPLTYHELAWVMEDVTNKKLVINSKKFLGRTEIEKILKKHFTKYEIKEEIIKEENRSLRSLLSKIKFSGTQGNSMSGKGLLTKEKLKKAQELYMQRFKKIEATHQLFFCWAAQ